MDAQGATVSAPGKLVLLGDYAVLEGGVAVVAAVDRRARGALGAARAPASPGGVVGAVLAAAARRGLEVLGEPEIDTTSFRDAGGSKLGLGSSAAVAVVAAALVTGRGDEATLELALEAHRDASGGEGSGVDVAASFHGGVIATRRQPATVEPLASRVGALEVYALYTGKSASTVDLVGACRRAPRWVEHVRGLSALAEEGLQAWRAQAAPALLSVVARYGRAMAALGRDAGVPVVTEEIAAIMRLAEAARGAAAKPSGAGGGDVALLFASDPELPRAIAAQTGTTLLELAVERRGLARK